MSLDNLFPFAGQHAIQSAAFAVDFSAELDVGEIARLRLAAAELKGDFPNVSDQKRMMLQFNSGLQGASSSAATSDGGFVLDRPASGALPAPPSRGIAVSRENVLVFVNDYTRWARFRADVERYLSVLLKSVNAQKGVRSIGLQFTDAFSWRADPVDLNLSEVFSKESKYLSPNIFSNDLGLWHSHHGYMMEKTEPVPFQQLDNVNVSRNELHGLQLQVLTSHKATFQKPLYKMLDANKEKIFAVLDSLHQKNKEILANVLTQEVQEKIGLNAAKD